jgi:hypothetical protein
VLTPSGVTLFAFLPYYLVCPTSNWYQSRTRSKKKIVGQATQKKKLQSKSTKPTHTMTKITFIYLPHEICAAAKTTAPTNIPKQEENALVKPINHLPSWL